ncbi:hypothetical protein BGX38DRAFT_1335328 [Terfezia claveryi]|nr:hypothetical protein BGX38DRAFT_1335328 [Terfezia claveryi]
MQMIEKRGNKQSMRSCSRIIDFGTLPQYSTEITEALHKPLKDAYRRSNHVDVAEQILDTVSRDYAIRMRELNLVAWSHDINLGADVLEMLADNAEGGDISAGNENGLVDPLSVRPWKVNRVQKVPAVCDCLPLVVSWVYPVWQRFCEYLRMNMDSSRGTPDTEKIGNYRSYYYNILAILFHSSKEMENQFIELGGLGKRVSGGGTSQGQTGYRFGGKSMHRWNCKWVNLTEGWLGVRRLFSVHDETQKVHEVALVVLLHLRDQQSQVGRRE